MSITLRDVAREAGVSVSTVSRVVRGTNYIDAATRQSVLDAIEKLQYHPNVLARRLKSGRTYTIGFVVNDIANPFFGHAVIGAENYLSSAGMSEFELFLVHTGGDPTKEIRAIEAMLSKRVEGIILASTAVPACIEAIRRAATEHHVPVVSIDNDLGGFEHGVVSADNQTGAYILTRHLIEHGHRRIGIISGPRAESHARERLAGFEQALADHGLAADDGLVGSGNWSLEDGYQLVRRWLGFDNPPTAIFGCNNFMCIGALYAIRERRLHVPHDVAVVSFDGVQFGDLLKPTLTTLDYDWRHIGEESARLILEGIRTLRAVQSPQRVNVPVRLLIRESCGCVDESER
jgi:LacI family repressor for deo operon, udp, cdd, tsx, nupC, and nupG